MRKLLFVFVLMAFVLPLLGCAGTYTVPPMKVAVRSNPAYKPDTDSIDKRFIYLTVGQSYDPKIDVLEDVADIPEGIVGLYAGKYLTAGRYENVLKRDVQLFKVLEVAPGQIAYLKNGEVKNPGKYRDLPDVELARLEPAVVIDQSHFGVRRTSDGKFSILMQGRYDNIPVSEVKIFRYGEWGYRLLPAERFDTNGKAQPSACDPSAFLVCEFPLDGAALKDTNVSALVTLDVISTFNADVASAKRLWELNSEGQAIQTYIAVPLRSARSLSSNLTAAEVKTSLGQAKLEAAYLAKIQEAQRGEPITTSKVQVRSVTIGSAAYEKQIQDQAAALEAERNRSALLLEQQKNQKADQDLAAANNDFKRNEALKDAQNQKQVNETTLSPFKNFPADLLWVLINGGQVKPTITENGKIIPAPTPQPPTK